MEKLGDNFKKQPEREDRDMGTRIDEKVFEKIENLADKKYQRIISVIEEILPQMDKSLVENFEFRNFDSDYGGGTYDVKRYFIEKLNRYLILDVVSENDTNYAWDYRPNLKPGDLLRENQFNAELDSYKDNLFEDEFRRPAYFADFQDITDDEKQKTIDDFKESFNFNGKVRKNGETSLKEQIRKNIIYNFFEHFREATGNTQVESSLDKKFKSFVREQREKRGPRAKI